MPIRRPSDIPAINTITDVCLLSEISEFIELSGHFCKGGEKAWYSGRATEVSDKGKKLLKKIEDREEFLSDVRMLQAVKIRFGRNYKSLVRQAWETGDYSDFSALEFVDCGCKWDDATALLQDLRNRRGPSWLARVSVNIEVQDTDVELDEKG